MSVLAARLAIQKPAAIRPAAASLLALLPATAADPRLRDQWGRATDFDTSGVADLLATLVRVDEPLAARAVDRLLADAALYDRDEVLVPVALRLWEEREPPAGAALSRLREAGVAHLQACTASEPKPPADATREARLGCACPPCVAVADFLKDPRRMTFEVKAVEGVRAHVEQTLKAAKADVSVETVRTGRPYRLVLTKTQASYERAAERFRRDRDRLACLQAARRQ